MADEAGTSSAALIHMQLARLYEARLEIEAARLVDEVILEECSVVEPSIQAALRLMA